jgi:tetratricopeptide (TPR) repeat protein
MQLPRVRISLKTLMIAIAALSVVLGCSIEGIRLKRRRDALLQKAAEHGQFEYIFRDDQKSALKMAEIADESRSSLEKLRQENPTPAPAIAGMSKTGNADLGRLNADLHRLKMEMEEDRRLVESLEKSPPKSWNADLDRRMMEANRRQAEWLEIKMERERIEAAEQRAKAARSAVTADYYAMLERKYVRAASRPWLSVEPDPPPPEHELSLTGNYWAELGQYAAALTAYEQAIKSRPNDILAISGLAWVLATCPEDRIREGKRAVELAKRACELSSGELANCVGTLAAAYAEVGEFEAASDNQRKAISMLSTKDPQMEPYRSRLALYVSHKPYRVATNH